MKGVAVGTIGTRAMLSAFAAIGLDRRRIQDEAGLTDRELADPDGLLPAERFYRMWEVADRHWERSGLGLHAAREVPFGALEVLDFLLSSSDSVEAGLAELAKYFALTTRTAHYELSTEDRRAVCEMVWRIPPRGVMFHLRDFSLVVVAGRIAHIGGRLPERVELSGPPLASVEEYERAFGARVVLRAARNALTFPLEVWRMPLARRDDDLNRTLRRHAQLLLERQPKGSERVSDRVAAELLRTAHVGLASIDVVSGRMGMSARTLQRRLRAEGETFEALWQQVRASLAQEYLGDRGLSISEVAYLLGFSESSAFTRAFRRWTGRTPKAFRARTNPSSTISAAD